MKTSETVKPHPHPFYGDSYERGLDPWHSDAFPAGLEFAGTDGPRNSGWFLIDGFGNAIGFIPDGTDVTETPLSELVVTPK